MTPRWRIQEGQSGYGPHPIRLWTLGPLQQKIILVEIFQIFVVLFKKMLISEIRKRRELDEDAPLTPDQGLRP